MQLKRWDGKGKEKEGKEKEGKRNLGKFIGGCDVSHVHVRNFFVHFLKKKGILERRHHKKLLSKNKKRKQAKEMKRKKREKRGKKIKKIKKKKQQVLWIFLRRESYRPGDKKKMGGKTIIDEITKERKGREEREPLQKGFFFAKLSWTRKKPKPPLKKNMNRKPNKKKNR